MEHSNRPSRSDAHLSKEEEAKIEGETREYFDGLAPKRHSKPQRSEYSTRYSDALSQDQGNGVIPEYERFQQLEHDDSQKLATGEREKTLGFVDLGPDDFTDKGRNRDIYFTSQPSEEFVETEYYNDLNGVDKQHHTTGTGFIKVEEKNGMGFNLGPESATGSACHASSKGNPATNEWTPAPADMADYASDKPQRSDN